MLDTSNIGKWIFFAGLIVMIVGGVIWLAGRFGLSLGRLPGDIRIEREGFALYIPLATSILLSLALTLIINLISRFFNNR
ncbi:MAG: DUF2905 domain-containing protein [Anaerolineales bacterium]